MTREDAIFYIKELQKTYASMDKKVAEAVDMAIEALQFAEHFDLLKEHESLQEVVRCKDCRHYESITDGYGMCRKRQTVLTTQREDDFCSYGERREE